MPFWSKHHVNKQKDEFSSVLQQNVSTKLFWKQTPKKLPVKTPKKIVLAYVAGKSQSTSHHLGVSLKAYIATTLCKLGWHFYSFSSSGFYQLPCHSFCHMCPAPHFRICIFQTKNCNSWWMQNWTLQICQLMPKRLSNSYMAYWCICSRSSKSVIFLFLFSIIILCRSWSQSAATFQFWLEIARL